MQFWKQESDTRSPVLLSASDRIPPHSKTGAVARFPDEIVR